MISTVSNLMDKVTGDVVLKLPKKLNKIQKDISKQLPMVMDKIPSLEAIESRMCSISNLNTVKKSYNQMGDSMDKANNILDKIDSLMSKIRAIIDKVKALLEGILTIADTISSIINALKATIIGLKAGVNGVAFIPSTVSTPIPVGPILILKDQLKKADDKVKLFSNVIKGITGKVEFIIPKLNILEFQTQKLEGITAPSKEQLTQSQGLMDKCMKDRLVAVLPPADSLEDGVTGGVDAQNQTLESLIDKENNNQGAKIEEFEKIQIKTIRYTVKTIPSEDLEN